MKTTYGKSFFTAVLILVTTLLVIGTAFQAMVKDYITDTAIDDLHRTSTSISQLAAAYCADGSLMDSSFAVDIDLTAQVSGADIIICDSTGRVILSSGTAVEKDASNLWVKSDYLNKVITNNGDTATGMMQGLYDEPRYVVSAPIVDFVNKNVYGIVMVSHPVNDTSSILGHIQDIFVEVSLLVIVVSVIIMILIARRQGSPLREMAAAARSFGHGDLDARVNIADDCPDDVADLALAFNNMASELQKSEYQRKEFVANVSHELKTPMTTIAGYVDGILDGTIPEERSRHYLQIVSDETKRLSRLVRSMLDISRLDQNGIPEEKKHPFDVEECAGQVLITFEQKINSKHLDVQVNMPEHPVYIMANQDYITQVIYNLLDNAVKFCPDGKILGLTVTEGGGKAYISVSNEGATIPPEELPLVFDRFHKLDKSRSENRDGWGLGLYIVKTIVCSHGENISVTSRDGKTEFTFTMPLVN